MHAIAVRAAVAALMLGGGALIPAFASQAVDGPQPVARSYAIDAGALSDVIARFAAISGVQLVFDPTALAEFGSPGLQGSYTVSQGFDELLADTGWHAQARATGGYHLQRVQTIDAGTGSDADMHEALPEVLVSGKAPGSTTEGSGLYTTFSTSSSTRLNLTPQETPQAVTVLTRQRLDDQQLETLVDALNATPGIFVQQGTIGQDGPNIYARGSSLGNFQIDGVPTSTSMSPFLANTAAYDRVEVVRGATGVMNGLGTPAATVNLIRKRPTAETQRTLTLQGGNWNRYGAGADLSGAVNESGTARLRLVGDYKRERAWVDRFEQKKQALYGIGEFDLGTHTLLTVGFNHLRQHTDSAIVSRPLYFSNGERIPRSRSDNISQEWRYYKHDMDGLFTSLEHRFASAWVGKVEYSHTRYDYDGLLASFLGAVDAETGAGVTIRPNRWKHRHKQDNLDAYVSGVFPLLGRDHELIAGLTLSQLKSQGPGYTLDADYPTATTLQDWANAPAPTFAQTSYSHGQERNYGAFVNARFTLTDATSLLLGGRATRWTRDYDEASTLWGDYATRERKSTFVPYAGIVHALNDTWSVYGSYTKIFRPQESWLSEYYPLAQLQPEEGVGYEAGVKAGFHGGRLTASLSVFRNEVDNLAVWNSDTYTYDLLGKTRAKGIELELNGELAPDWQLAAGYAYSTIEDNDGERVLTYVPRQTLKLFTSYRLPGAWDRFTLGGGLQWQNALTSGSDFNHRQGSFALVSLMVRYQLDRSLSVSLNLNNALDKHYFSSTGSHGTYGAPRNFMVSARYSF
ncbi:TonB-dependent siderophore receptor [Corticibacter populi]|uniref:TonB-dependent siderophore receptor n=1 Tax=Corticibacter populi TaxID=1550736 RepID=A0A3M6R0G2_9BURK|nr:TonB-dependent receptor [Corticibacter populi]RMX08744.1 TonB-dependent siderophore receptor [Corticibacter populi]